MDKEKNQEKKNNRKYVYLGIFIIALLLALLALFFLLNDKGYRSILVASFHGDSNITHENGNVVSPYRGLQLFDGDDVVVQDASDLTLQVDSDKHLYASANTHFWIEATGKERSTRTTIQMDNGGTLHCIDGKLGSDESYKVVTPNSTMSVRGTVFRVVYYLGSDGNYYTLLEVYEGVVEVVLNNPQDAQYKEPMEYHPGQAALIQSGPSGDDYVLTDEVEESIWIGDPYPIRTILTDGTGDIHHEISYRSLPQDVAKVLVSYIQAGNEICIGEQLLKDYTQLSPHQMDSVSEVAATCTSAGKFEYRCKICDESTYTTVFSPLGHVWKEETVLQEPACTEPGLLEHTCLVCEETEQEEIAAVGHVWSRVAVEKAPTCMEKGQTKYVCTICGTEELRETSATGHKPVIEMAIPGFTPGSKCQVCGEILVPRRKIDSSDFGASGSGQTTVVTFMKDDFYVLEIPINQVISYGISSTNLNGYLSVEGEIAPGHIVRVMAVPGALLGEDGETVLPYQLCSDKEPFIVAEWTSKETDGAARKKVPLSIEIEDEAWLDAVPGKYKGQIIFCAWIE